MGAGATHVAPHRYVILKFYNLFAAALPSSAFVVEQINTNLANFTRLIETAEAATK